MHFDAAKKKQGPLDLKMKKAVNRKSSLLSPAKRLQSRILKQDMQTIQ